MTKLNLLEEIIKMYPNQKDIFLSLFQDDTPIGYLEGVTIYLLKEKKININEWINFLNKIYDKNDREICKAVEYSLEVLFLHGEYNQILELSLSPDLKELL